MGSQHLSERRAPVANQGGNERQPDSVRVLLVGDDVSELRDVEGTNVVGATSADELVPAIDMLEPQVLLLSSRAAGLAAPMSSGPAGVVVTQSREMELLGSPAGTGSFLEIVLRLALICP